MHLSTRRSICTRGPERRGEWASWSGVVCKRTSTEGANAPKRPRAAAGHLSTKSLLLKRLELRLPRDH
jgi:hypothetical protein